MYLISKDDGEMAKIPILKSFPLSITSGKKPSGCRRAATTQPSHRNALSARSSPSRHHKAMVSRKATPSNRLSLPPANVTTSQVTKFKYWAEDAINNQQRQIDRIAGTVSKIEKDISLFKDFMLEVRSEISSTRQIADLVGEEDLSSLREELNRLRQKVEESGQAISRANDDSSRSLESVSQHVEQVGQKVGEVDELKLELARMRARVEFLETKPQLPPTLNRQLRPCSGRNKRRQSELDSLCSPSEEPPREPFQKKSKITSSSPNEESSGATSHVERTSNRRHAPTREVIEIMSSEHDTSSPIPNEEDEEDRFNIPNNVHNSQRSIPNSTSSTHILEESSGNRQASTSLQTPTADKAHSAVSRPGTSRIEVLVPYSPNLAMSVQQQAGRVRDESGVLLLSNGKVDGRSLRFKKRTTSKEDVGSDYQETGFSKTSREWTPIARSSSRAMNSSPAPGRQDSVSPGEGEDSQRKGKFKCETCKKVYSVSQGLEYVSTQSPNPFQWLEKVLTSVFSSTSNTRIVTPPNRTAPLWSLLLATNATGTSKLCGVSML